MEKETEPTKQKAARGYGKHSKKQWLIVYLVLAVIIYIAVYLIFFRKTASSSGGFSY